MSLKQKGKCPFCSKSVQAIIFEENTVRRDKCRCPECDETIYICRVLGCHDYAKGTDIYDHELCPACTATAANVASSVGSATGKAAVAVGLIVATEAAKAHFKK